MKRLKLGKYGALVTAVATFLALFLGVMGVNVLISRDTARETSMLNLAGWQRTQAQQMARTLLQIQQDAGEGKVASDLRDELRETARAFDSTLRVLTEGGPTTRLDGTAVDIPAARTEDLRRILMRAQRVWAPLHEALQPLYGAAALEPAQADAAALLASGETPPLFAVMNDLAKELERDAQRRERLLQSVLGIGMLLAIANFAFIAVHSIGQLRRADRTLERAQRETADILRTVQEGLFLLDRRKRIGAQQSRHLSSLFGRDDLAGTDFVELLRGRVAEGTVTLATDYIDLLFGERVNEKLVQSLNPLQEVELAVADAHGGQVVKHLDIRFARVQEHGRTTHLLVTVVDVTERVRLTRELEAAKLQAKDQFTLLAHLMRGDPARVVEAAAAVRAAAQRINAVLRQRDDDGAALHERVESIFAEAHRLKGRASGLGIDTLETAIQQFEGLLVGLRGKPGLRGDDFLPLTVALDGLLAQVDQLEAIARAMRVGAQDGARSAGSESAHAASAVTDAGSAAAIAAGDQGDAGNRGAAGVRGEAVGDARRSRPTAAIVAERQLATVAQRAAARQGKQIELEVAGFERVPRALEALVSDVAVQLVRNAIAHGIEPAHERVSAGKDATGSVIVDVAPNLLRGVTLTVQDDGRGLNLAAVRARLGELGWFDPQALAAMSERDAAMQIFRSGFSTRAGEADADSGQGVGLDVVRRLAASAGGRLQVQSVPGRSMCLRVVLPPPAPVPHEAAMETAEALAEPHSA